MGSMANDGQHGSPQGVGRKLRTRGAVFLLDAGNNPTITSHATLAEARLSAVTVAATGVVRFTLLDNGAKIVSCNAHYMAAVNNVDMYAQALQPTTDTQLSFDVQLKTGAVNTNPAASPNGGKLSIEYTWECG